MKFFITAIGTRGDVEPFLAIGDLLSTYGHKVIMAFPQQYCHLVKDGIKYYEYTPLFLELLESKEGKDIMTGSSGLGNKVGSFYQLYKNSLEINQTLAQQQFEFINKEDPDVVIHHPKCTYPPFWSKLSNKKSIMVSPVPYYLHYHPEGNHLGFAILPKFLRKMTYQLANFGLATMIKSLSKNWNLPSKLTTKSILKTYLDSPLVYTISPILLNAYKNWPQYVQVLGYHERNRSNSWTPTEKLLQFLSAHPKILFLTFGSMIHKNPKETTELFLKVLIKLKIPTLINTAGGGLIKVEHTSDNIQFVETIPYEWILPKVYCAIHHGGSGTIHSSLKYGCSTMIVPHIIDQYMWSEKVSQLGAGPKGVAIDKINMNNLEEKITDLWNNQSYKYKSGKISEAMKNEDLQDKLYQFLVNVKNN
jgi:sterol 3beta-glucosyltransferase